MHATQPNQTADYFQFPIFLSIGSELIAIENTHKQVGIELIKHKSLVHKHPK